MQDIVKERMEESAAELMEAKGGKPRRGTEDWERGLKGVMEIINVMLGSTLDVANSIELDAVDKMKRRDLWCREVKRAGGDVLRRHRLLFCTFRRNNRKVSDLYVELLDVIQEEITRDVKLFYFPIKRVMDRYRVEDSDMMADIEVATTLLDLGRLTYETVCEIGRRELGVQLERAIFPVDPRPLLHRWKELRTMVMRGRYPEGLLEALNKDADVQRGVDVLCRKLVDTAFMDEMCQRIVSEHPDWRERLETQG